MHIYSFLVLAPILPLTTAVATIGDTHSSLFGIHRGHSCSPPATWARLSAAWLRSRCIIVLPDQPSMRGSPFYLPSLPRADYETICPTDIGGVFPAPVLSFRAGACARSFDRATPLHRYSFPSLAWHPADHAYSVALPSLQYSTYGPEV